MAGKRGMRFKLFTKNVNLFEDHEVTNYGRDEVYGIKDQIYGQD